MRQVTKTRRHDGYRSRVSVLTVIRWPSDELRVYNVFLLSSLLGVLSRQTQL